MKTVTIVKKWIPTTPLQAVTSDHLSWLKEMIHICYPGTPNDSEETEPDFGHKGELNEIWFCEKGFLHAFYKGTRRKPTRKQQSRAKVFLRGRARLLSKIDLCEFSFAKIPRKACRFLSAKPPVLGYSRNTNFVYLRSSADESYHLHAQPMKSILEL